MTNNDIVNAFNGLLDALGRSTPVAPLTNGQVFLAIQNAHTVLRELTQVPPPAPELPSEPAASQE